MSSPDEKTFSDEKYTRDSEKQSFNHQDDFAESVFGPGRRMVRIAPPPSGSISEEATDIGKQMEMEAGNAIKYRTCSWQKVNTSRFQFLSILKDFCFDLRVNRDHEYACTRTIHAQ